MIDVTLYTRNDCHLCEEAKLYLDELQSNIPHRLTIIDVDSDPKLIKLYGFNVPVVLIGPYKLTAPIQKKDLEISLLAIQHKETQELELDRAIREGRINIPVEWSKSDGISMWLAKHYLAIFNTLVFIYLFMPIFAPVLMNVGADKPAGVIYRVYGFVCHQLAFRSWFLLGEQVAYPREAAGITDLVSYEEATGLNGEDLLSARAFVGNQQLGYKVALCQRDVAIYSGILLFGIIFALSNRKLKSLHWLIWMIFGILPIALDGISQLISQPPLSFIPLRESTPLIRTITGFLFGFLTAWFGYPYVEESMSTNRKYLEGKLEKVRKQESS